MHLHTHTHIYTYRDLQVLYTHTLQHSYTYTLIHMPCTHSTLRHTHTFTLLPQRVRMGLGRRGAFWEDGMAGSAKGWVSRSLVQGREPKVREDAVGL